jgi:ribonuclease P protein component
MGRATFTKQERLVNRKRIDLLFSGSRSVATYPLRAVYINKVRAEEDAVQLLISVPKKRFHHAVDRNRVKRQIREAYRKNKWLLYDALPADKQLLLAFVWLSDRHLPSAEVEHRVVSLLQRVAEEQKK